MEAIKKTLFTSVFSWKTCNLLKWLIWIFWICKHLLFLAVSTTVSCLVSDLFYSFYSLRIFLQTKPLWTALFSRVFFRWSATIIFVPCLSVHMIQNGPPYNFLLFFHAPVESILGRVSSSICSDFSLKRTCYYIFDKFIYHRNDFKTAIYHKI